VSFAHEDAPRLQASQSDLEHTDSNLDLDFSQSPPPDFCCEPVTHATEQCTQALVPCQSLLHKQQKQLSATTIVILASTAVVQQATVLCERSSLAEGGTFDMSALYHKLC